MRICSWRKDCLESCERCGAFSRRREVWQSKKEKSVLTSRAHVRLPKARNTAATIAEPQAAKKSRSRANAITKPASRSDQLASPRDRRRRKCLLTLRQSLSDVWLRGEAIKFLSRWRRRPSFLVQGKGEVCPKSACQVACLVGGKIVRVCSRFGPPGRCSRRRAKSYI